jgi:tetratricopeptide (TPR) repeat protein
VHTDSNAELTHPESKPVKPSRKHRWLLRAVIGMSAVVLGALGGAYVMSSSHGDLVAAAQSAFEQGEQARKQFDLEGARRAYETADAKLERLLAREPNHPHGLVLRYQTLSALYLVVARQEEDQGQTTVDRPSAGLLRKASECLGRALADSQNVEAQGIALGTCFTRDDMSLAAPFAEQVVRGADQKDVPNYASYQIGARYVLAWQLLQGSSPQPDDALIHLQESRKLEDPPRWRALALEAKALKIKADREMRLSGARPSGAPHDGSRSVSAQALHRLLAAALERAQRELDALPRVTRDSPTNLRGLLDLLELAIGQGVDGRDVGERVKLLVTVSEKLLAEESPRETSLSEIATRAARLPQLVAQMSPNRHPRPEEWSALTPRIEQLALRAVNASTAAGPALCLDLARNARHEGQLAPTERFARKGLELAATQKVAPSDPTVLALQAELVWVLVCDGRATEELAKHLEPLRKNSRFVNDAKGQFVEGLLALQDGRLHTAARRLEQVQKEGYYRDTVYSWLGLAYAYMALGQPDRAQPYLEKLQEPVRNSTQLPEAARTIAERLFPTPQSLKLELFRAYIEQNQLERALTTYQELLPFKPERVTAAVELINFYAAQGWRAWTDRKPQRAKEMFEAAARELREVRPLAGEDGRLLWAEINLLLERATTEQVPTDQALRQAEDRIRTAAAQTPGAPEGTLALARWLIFRNRPAEAEDLLAGLEKSNIGPHKVQMQLLRAQIGARRAQTPDEAEEAETLAELLQPTVRWLDDPALIEPRAALSQYEQVAFQYYAQAVQSQARGDFQQAARAFERALPYARFRGPSRRGLLGALLALANKSPKETIELADELWNRQRDEPILLVVAANAALRLDNFDLMQKDLKSLEELLKRKKQDPTLAPCLLARNWLAAGRSDLARRELTRALKADPAHQPSLELAARLARTDDDWKSCLRYSRALAALQPHRLEARQWQAAALSYLGDGAEAQKIARELVQTSPPQSAGYEVMVNILERAGDYTGALAWARAWRTNVPDDDQSLRAIVRVTVHSGGDAVRVVEAERQRMNPEREFNAAWAAAQGFFDARAYQQAEYWASKALAQTERGSAILSIQLLLGETYNRLGQSEKAIEVYRTVWKDHPGHFTAGMKLAWLLDQSFGQADAAYAILHQLRHGRFSQRPISGDRLSLEFLNVVGVVCRDSHHAKEAVALFEEAAQRYTDEPLVYLHLGRAYADRNRPQEATQNLEKAAQLAEKRARSARDADIKARWLALATEARQDLQGPK